MKLKDDCIMIHFTAATLNFNWDKANVRSQVHCLRRLPPYRHNNYLTMCIIGLQ